MSASRDSHPLQCDAGSLPELPTALCYDLLVPPPVAHTRLRLHSYGEPARRVTCYAAASAGWSGGTISTGITLEKMGLLEQMNDPFVLGGAPPGGVREGMLSLPRVLARCGLLNAGNPVPQPAHMSSLLADNLPRVGVASLR